MILECIPTNMEGRRTLVACTLIATWWTGPSQRRLFSSISINQCNRQRWMNGVTRSVPKAHRHDTGTEYLTRGLAQDPREYFPVLRNTRNLTLSCIQVERADANQLRTYLSAFRECLTHLSLERITVSFSTFVTLVDYFPNITNLNLCAPGLGPDEGSVPPLSQPLRGKALVRASLHNSLKFFDRFAKLDLEYEELVVGPMGYVNPTFLENAFQMSTSTVKCLRLMSEIECEQRLPTYQTHTLTQPSHVQAGVTPTIHRFRQLQEFELVVTQPRDSHRILLSSITSTRLRKVIFRVWYTFDGNSSPEGTGRWTWIDEELCRLVDRLCAMGYCHTLEAELRFLRTTRVTKEHGLTKVLPKFKEKGVVTVFDAHLGEYVFNSSTHNREG